MESDADAVDALFAEAYALLEEASSSSPTWSQDSHVLASFSSSSSVSSLSQPSTVSQPSSPAAHALATPRYVGERETSAARLKRLIRTLRAEEQQLTAQLDRLRGAIAPSMAKLRDRAMVEQLERRRAETEREALRTAVITQTQFLRGIRGLFSTDDSRGALSMNLCHQLHNFTRLPKDKSIRQHEYAALRREGRVHAAIELLLRETDAISNARDFVDATFVNPPGEPCTVTSTSVFLMDGCDVPTVLRAACVAVRDIVLRCRSYQWAGVAGEIVDADSLSASDLQYRVTSIQRRARDAELGPFSVEARALTMYRMIGDAAVVLWDFVDEDELHPLDQAPDVFRQGVGACLIRREVCSDGVQRTVYREVSTRRYEYRGLTPPSPSVVRYFSSKRHEAHEYEWLFRDLMLEQIAWEKAATSASMVGCCA